MRYEKTRNIVVSLTHCNRPNRMKVPPSMMKPAGKIALTPHIDRYFPTRGPRTTQKSHNKILQMENSNAYQIWTEINEWFQILPQTATTWPPSDWPQSGKTLPAGRNKDQQRTPVRGREWSSGRKSTSCSSASLMSPPPAWQLAISDIQCEFS